MGIESINVELNRCDILSLIRSKNVPMNNSMFKTHGVYSDLHSTWRWTYDFNEMSCAELWDFYMDVKQITESSRIKR